MARRVRRPARLTRVVLVAVAVGSVLAACSNDSGSGDATGGGAAAPVTAVRGSACGYTVSVGLFAGPPQQRGCGQQAGSPTTAASPSVTLPPAGAAAPVTASDPDGAAAQYGPAVIMGGRWPDNVAAAPPSGPIAVSTEGSPASGKVTSSARIGLHPTPVPAGCYAGAAPPCSSPGGFGPSPVEGDELHVTCTASPDGVTGSATFKNAVVATSTDADGDPVDTEPIPESPPANYTRSGVITNVGDVFTAVYNEQIVNADGSLTVNGVHMYLFGPTAVGEVVKGQVTCGTTPAGAAAEDAQPPTCGTLVVAPVSPTDPTPKAPRTELVGVFDTGGLQEIRDVKATNGTVQVGEPTGLPHLKLAPGQTGPLAVRAIRSAQAEAGNLPMAWSFEAVDKAGNATRCPAKRA